MNVKSNYKLDEGIFQYIMAFDRNELYGNIPVLLSRALDIAAERIADDMLKGFDMKQISTGEIKNKVLESIASKVIEKMLKNT